MGTCCGRFYGWWGQKETSKPHQPTTILPDPTRPDPTAFTMWPAPKTRKKVKPWAVRAKPACVPSASSQGSSGAEMNACWPVQGSAYVQAELPSQLQMKSCSRVVWCGVV